MSLSWASHWNYAGMILDWAEKSGITAPKVQTNNATGPLRKTTVILWCFFAAYFRRDVFAFLKKTPNMYQVPSAQVVPPPIQIVAQMIKLPTGAQCHIQEVHPIIFNWTRIWQSNPEKGKKKVSTCKSLEDLPIENWTLEVSIWSCITGFPKCWCLCHHVRHQNSWDSLPIKDISKFHSQSMNSLKNHIYITMFDGNIW